MPKSPRISIAVADLSLLDRYDEGGRGIATFAILILAAVGIQSTTLMAILTNGGLVRFVYLPLELA